MSLNDQIYLGAPFNNSDSTTLNPGDVVHLDLTSNASVRRTTTASATDVFGIIVVGGTPNSKVIVASFRGQRLRVNVSPSEVVAVGDKIVTSATAGLAKVDNAADASAIFATACTSKTGGSGNTVEIIYSAVSVSVDVSGSGVNSSRVLTAGAGMTGGGDLTANRTFDVVANADGSIVVNANDIQVGVISDAQHGNRGGGSLHAVATTTVAGFMSAADKTQLDANNVSFVVANLAALAAINTTTFPAQGVRRFVTTVREWFQLDKASSRTADGITIIAATTGGGFWTRENRGDPIWGTFPFVSIDPVNGSDEAFGFGTSLGAADAVALKSFAELNRRIPEGGFTEDITCHVLDSIPDDQEDFMILTRLKVQSYDTKFLILGALTSAARPSLFTGTVSSYTAPTPASNTERRLTITGAPGSSLVGKLIQKADGSKSAYVLRLVSGSTYHISIPKTVNAAAGSLGSATEFANGDSVVIYDLLTMPIHPFPASVFSRDVLTASSNLILTNTKLRASDTTHGVEIDSGGSSSKLINCILVDPIVFGGVNSVWGNVLFTSDVIGLAFMASVDYLTLDNCSLLNTQILIQQSNLQILTGLDIEGNSSQTSFAHFHMQRGTCSLTSTSAIISMYNSVVTLINSDEGSCEYVGVATTTYGSGNTGPIYGLTSGCRWLFSSSTEFITTSAAHPIVIKGIGYDFTALPISLAFSQVLFDSV